MSPGDHVTLMDILVNHNHRVKSLIRPSDGNDKEKIQGKKVLRLTIVMNRY